MLISTGKMIKHNWFERPKPGQKVIPLIERKLPVNFIEKEEVYNLMYTIQEVRDNLVYGKGNLMQVRRALENFQLLKNILKQKLQEEGEEIE